jgi:DNA-binding response OmpR family regulator
MATVLIIDDDEDVRDLLTVILRRHGHATVAAATIEQAADHLSTTDVDAVLLDARLNGASGVHLCRTIRRDPTADPIAIILLSGDATSQHITAGLAAGADDYITKPFRRADLLTRLDAALTRSTAKPPHKGAAQAARAAAQAAHAMCHRLQPQPAQRTA